MLSRKPELQLFEFLLELIDIQIKKYVALGKRGVGPDARLNSTLVYDEATELMNFANILVNNFDKGNLAPIKKIAEQIYFYLKCEGIRSLAGHLLDKNNIHDTVFIRIVEQKDKFRLIMRNLGLQWSEDLNPQTEIQQACKYESCQIALKILQLVRDIEENPEIEWDIKLVPHHAQLAIKKNSREGRYKEQASKINGLYDICIKHIESMDKPTHFFPPMDAREVDKFAAFHINIFNKLLKQYEQMDPSSPLFSSHHLWYEVGKLSHKPIETPSSSSAACKFFAKTVVPLFLIGCLITYFTQALEDPNAPALR